MVKKIVFASPEALAVQGGVLCLMKNAAAEHLSVKEAASAVGMKEGVLKALWKKGCLGDPLSGSGFVALEGDEFCLKIRLSDMIWARVTANYPVCTAEEAGGVRWEVGDHWNETLKNLMPGAQVLILKRAADRAELLATAPAGERTVVCRAMQESSIVAVENARFRDTYVYLEEPLAGIAPGTIVSVTLPAAPAGYPEPVSGRLQKVIGACDDAATQLEVALTKFALPHVFPEAVIKQAEALPDDPAAEEAENRVDLRDIPFMTIDGEDARDFDDAVWAGAQDGGWRLLVAIADVSHYVVEGSALDDEAQKRATSVYFPSCVIPMLPEKLSNGLCSLNPDVDRCVMVCDMRISADGLTTAYQFYPGLIHSHARLTYTAVWNAINGDPADLLARHGAIEDVYVLYDLYKALRAARDRRGAIDFETQETQVVTGEAGLIEAIVRRDHNDAHRLIEECMLAANVCAADFIERKKAMSLFRVHEPPAPDRLAQLRTMLASLGLVLGGGDKPSAADFDKVIESVCRTALSDVVQSACLRTMQRAMYTPDNVGHYGLNYTAYTHFTSPIRRYPDLLVHRTIRALLKRRKYSPVIAAGADVVLSSASGEKVAAMARQRKEKRGETRVAPRNVKQHEVWETLGLIASSCERRADEASRDVTAWLKCRFMENVRDTTFEAVVTGVIGAGLFITLDAPFVDGFVHVSRIGDDYFDFDEKTSSLMGRSTGKVYRLGSRLKVALYEVDADMRRIDFIAVGSVRREKTAPRRGRFEEADPWSWDWDGSAEDFDFEAFCGEKPSRQKKKSGKTAKSTKSANNSANKGKRRSKR